MCLGMVRGVNGMLWQAFVRGMSLMVLAFPVGWLADNIRRSVVLKIAGKLENHIFCLSSHCQRHVTAGLQASLASQQGL